MSKKKESEDSHKKILHIKTTNGYELWIDACQYKEIKYWNGWVTLIKNDDEEKHKKIGPIAFIEDNDTKAKELELLLDKVNSKLDYFIDYVTDDSWMVDATEFQEFTYWKENIQKKTKENKGGTQQYEVKITPRKMPVDIPILGEEKERVFYMPDNSKRELLEKCMEECKPKELTEEDIEEIDKNGGIMM